MHIRTPSALTEEALKRIGELYAIEGNIRGMPAEQRLAERERKTKPLLKSLRSWLREKMKALSQHSELAKAFAYALNQWPILACYVKNGWAEAGRVEMWRGGFSSGISVNPPLSIGGALLS